MQIIKVKSVNSLSKIRGCENGASEIINCLKNIKSNENGKLIEFDKLKFDEIHVDPRNIEEANYLIFQSSKEIFERNFKSFFLGGDHCISYPILMGFKSVQENPLVIVFDAHADCKLGGKEPTNREWLRKLIEKGFLASQIVLISTRNLDSDEVEFLAKNKIRLIKMDILREDLEGVCDLVMERARASLGFYISIDIDCVDPGFAPGVSDIEAGGMSSRDLIYFIKRLVLLQNFKGADIVEVNPSRDINSITSILGAKILSEMI